MGKHELFEVSNYVIVYNRAGGVLLLQASEKNKFVAGKWGFPGGHVERGETVEESINREVSEEAGISVTNIKPVAVDIVGSTYTTIFKAAAVSEGVVLSGEHSAFRWVIPGELDTFDLIDKKLVQYVVNDV